MLHPYVETRRTNLKPLGCLSEKDLREKIQDRNLSNIDGAEEFLSRNAEPPGEVLGHVALEHSGGSQPIGVASVHRIAGDRGGGAVQMLQDDGSLVHGMGVEANLLLMNYLFATWDLERIYFTPDSDGVEHVSNYPGMVDAVSRGDVEIPGWDDGRAVFCMERANWESVGSMFLKVLVRRSSN